MTIFTDMNNVAVINLINKNEYFEFPFFEDQTVFDKIKIFSEKLMDVKKVVLLLSEEKENDFPYESIYKDKWTEEDLFIVFKDLSSHCDNLFYYWGDYPLLDIKLTQKMFNNHIKYYAGYTFADGYPLGLSPEILRSEDIEALYNLSKGSHKKIGRNSIFEVLQKDINAFDIETEISPVDLRMYRISLSCDSKRNSEQLKMFIDSGITNRETFLEKIDKSQKFLRTKPAYYQIQITDSCPHLCSYCPFSKEAAPLNKMSFMSKVQYGKILDDIVFLSDDATIALSAWGEPSLHNDIINIVEETLKRSSLNLLIETSGVGWNEEIFAQIHNLSQTYKSPVQWIVSLDALDRGLYEKLRGAGYDEAYETAHKLIDLFGENAWVQAVRMKDSEVNLEDFFRYWKNKTENIIIQKFDWFSGKYEQKKITDLSPLKRDPCWHIKRDMFIKINGDVPLCREDLNSEHKLGNVFEDKLETIWNNGEKYYLAHIKKDYPEMCKNCDEYYTFNF